MSTGTNKCMSKGTTARRVVVAEFTTEHELLEATRDAHAHGLEIRDAYTPYAVHGLDEAMGLAPSRLPWVCFIFGLGGAIFKIWFEFWTTSVDWPVNVGGKPWNSWPAFVPITFEVMVLLAGLSTVAAFFLRARLYPGKSATLPSEQITDARFVLVLGERDARFESGAVHRLLSSHGAVSIRETIEESN